MALLSANSISLSFGERTLFKPTNFEIQKGEKIGIIGANGSGKTTLFKLINGQLKSDTGGFARQKGLRIGYMEQIVSAHSDKSVIDTALEVFTPLMEAQVQLEQLTEQLSSGDENIIIRHQRLREQFEADGGLTYLSRTKSALLGLGFTQQQLDLPLSSLSGGQLSKLSLAKLLLSDAHLLLLDEPTNHLDIKSCEWLEAYLKGYPGAALIISHDRYFLDAVTSRTFEIEHERISDFKGSYSAYLELKAKQREEQLHRYNNAVAEIERLEAVIKQQHQWNREKNIKTADSKQKVVDKLRNELVKPESELDSIRFRFTPKLTGSNDVVEVNKLEFSYGSQPLYSGVNFKIRRGERVFLLGDNGCGKTTLLKQLLANQGNIKFGSSVNVGYFDQTQATLSESKTALDEVWDEFNSMSQSEIRSALAAFLFKGDDVFKPVNKLSGGERARLMLLKTMLAGDNLLLLDEPTNHLDLYSRQALEDALADYTGTMLIVSHDRRFIDRLADRIFVMENGGITEYNGNYSYYINHRPTDVQAQAKPIRTTGAGGIMYKARKEHQAELRRLRSRVAAIEKQLDDIQLQIEQANADLAQTASDYQLAIELTRKIADLNERQNSLMDEWAELSEQLEQAEIKVNS